MIFQLSFRVIRSISLSGAILTATPGTKYIDLDEAMKELADMKVKVTPITTIDEKSLTIRLTPNVRDLIFY